MGHIDVYRQAVQNRWQSLRVPLCWRLVYGAYWPLPARRTGWDYRTGSCLFSLVLFGLAAFLLYRLGYTRLSVLFAGVAMVRVLLALVFDYTFPVGR